MSEARGTAKATLSFQKLVTDRGAKTGSYIPFFPGSEVLGKTSAFIVLKWTKFCHKMCKANYIYTFSS